MVSGDQRLGQRGAREGKHRDLDRDVGRIERCDDSILDAVCGRKGHAHRCSADQDLVRRIVALAGRERPVEHLVELGCVDGSDRGRGDHDDILAVAGKTRVGVVGAAGPGNRGIEDGELVVLEAAARIIEHHRDLYRLQPGVEGGIRGIGGRLVVADNPYRQTAGLGRGERIPHTRAIEVVQGDVDAGCSLRGEGSEEDISRTRVRRGVGEIAQKQRRDCVRRGRCAWRGQEPGQGQGQDKGEQNQARRRAGEGHGRHSSAIRAFSRGDGELAGLSWASGPSVLHSLAGIQAKKPVISLGDLRAYRVGVL